MRRVHWVKGLGFVFGCAMIGLGVGGLLNWLLPDTARDRCEERLDQARAEHAGGDGETGGDQVAEEHGAVGVEGDLESGAREE